MLRIFRKNLPFLGALITLGAALLLMPGPSSREEELPPPVQGEPCLAQPHEALLAAPRVPDFILEAYRDGAFREGVLAFFGALAGSGEVAALILDKADLFDISPSLAFALCREESRYNPRALNRANRDKTIDRGLFQLNSASFPRLSEGEFFDPAINAHYGMAHLRWCLDSGGSEVAGLAMYNAGTGRVHSGGTPKNTLDYTGRILESRQKIETLFRAEYSRLAAIQAPPPEPPPVVRVVRPALLSPLGRASSLR